MLGVPQQPLCSERAATVRVRNADTFTTTPAGAFTLGSLAEGQDVDVTAWANGYSVAYARVTPPAGGVTLTLRRYHITDHPGRQMIRTIRAADAQGHDLIRRAGSVAPGWGGAQAGLPGKASAKVLQDVATGEAPVVSYWKQTRIASDNRLAALQNDTTELPQERCRQVRRCLVERRPAAQDLRGLGYAGHIVGQVTGL